MSAKVRLRRGKWWVFINHDGKRKARCIGERRAAQIVAEKINAKLALGTFGLDVKDSVRQPFEAYFRSWLESYVRGNCKRATYATYDSHFRTHLLPHFGQTEIAKITREHVKRLVYGLLARRSRATVRAVVAPLSEMFNHAIEDGHVTSNPALRVLPRRRSDVGEARGRISFLKRDELSRLLAVCRQHFPRWYAFVLLLARTGVRLGEAAALQWDDLDLTARVADVQRTLDDGRPTTPKSGKGRQVDLSAHLAATLRKLLVQRKKTALRLGQHPAPWIFPNAVGKPIDTDNFRARVWTQLLAKADLRRIRIQDLRHTYASLLIAQGESLAYIRDQMGHHSIRLTVDTYGHLVPGGNRAAVDRLDDDHDAPKRNPRATTPDRD